jgi:pyruvate/2-oxoglutarate dehydrogenase complex dihydrolipoamide dehydrogenase (E3) component
LTNETVFSLTKLPRRLAVIGGGPVGCELSQAFARLGSEVALLASREQLLPREDRDAARIVENALDQDGVRLWLGTKITQAARRGTEKVISFEQTGRRQDLVVDEILVGIGRAPNLEGLGLDAAGVAYDAKLGVSVNERLQTSNRRIYAAGDICSTHKFTHTADALARILIANALFMGRQKSSALVIPWCTYTDPEVAHVGMYEQEAQKNGVAVTTLTVPLGDVDRALIDGEINGFARVHLQKGTDKILGATVVARHAGEMINELTLAMSAGLGLSAIGRTIHPYPTQAEAIRKLADAYNRTRLTPFVKKVLGGWLRWQKR